MTIRTFALLLLLLTAVFASRWLLHRPQQDLRTGSERTASAPGYYLRDATVLGTGRDGKPLYSLHAARIDEATDGAGARLSEINLEYRAEAADPWHLRADSGRISADGQTIELAGNVIITELDIEEAQATHVYAADLTVDVDSHFASTEHRVRILRGASHLDGTGMQAFLSEGKLQLQSDVQGQYSQ